MSSSLPWLLRPRNSFSNFRGRGGEREAKGRGSEREREAKGRGSERESEARGRGEGQGGGAQGGRASGNECRQQVSDPRVERWRGGRGRIEL